MNGGRLIGIPFVFLAFSGWGVCQSVISTHAGLVNYFEGSVLIDGKELAQAPGSFASLPNGSELRTERGRAELLITPGAFLRVDRDSTVRMVSNSLSAAKLEVLEGSVIFDSTGAAPAGSSATLIYKSASIQFPRAGIYRIDAEPPVLQVYAGRAEVLMDGKTSTIDASHLFFFTLDMKTEKFGDGSEADDDFYEWAKNRSETIDEQNRIAAETSQDPNQDAGALAAAPDVDSGGIPGLSIPDGSGSIGVTPFGIAPYTPAYGAYASIPLGAYVPAPLFAVVVPRYWSGVIHPARIYPEWHHRPWEGGSVLAWHPGQVSANGLVGITHSPLMLPELPSRPMTAYRPWVGRSGTAIRAPRYSAPVHFGAPGRFSAPHYSAPMIAIPRGGGRR
jgi:hypothetical protein